MPETRAGDAALRQPAPPSDAFAAMGGSYWEGVRRMQTECMAFMAERLEDDRRTLQALAECSDVGDVMDVQRRWAARCGDAYLREGPKLAAIALETVGVGPPAAR